MNGMKNVKPAYAVKLGDGVFAGEKWVCVKCGIQTIFGGGYHDAGWEGKCLDTSSGNHIWQQC